MAGTEIRYAKSVDGLDIAYQILGDGPVDFVFVAGFITHLDWSWELPHFAWLEQLDAIARVITFDKRGTGLSDRSLGFGSLEERSRDIAAVMDAAGSERAVLCGVSEGGPMSILFAATNPDRVAGLVLVAAFPCGRGVPDAVWQTPPDSRAAYLEHVERDWGTGKVFGRFIGHPPDPEAARRLISHFERNACTPKLAAEIMRSSTTLDARPVLETISARTLVIHAWDDPVVPFVNGQYLAEHMTVPDSWRSMVISTDRGDLPTWPSGATRSSSSSAMSVRPWVRRRECCPPCCSPTSSPRPRGPPRWATPPGTP